MNLGADDYLVKPFAFSELLARIRSVLRRGGERQTEVIEIADLKVDLVRREVIRAGTVIRTLRAKEFALLALFCTN